MADHRLLLRESVQAALGSGYCAGVANSGIREEKSRGAKERRRGTEKKKNGDLSAFEEVWFSPMGMGICGELSVPVRSNGATSDATGVDKMAIRQRSHGSLAYEGTRSERDFKFYICAPSKFHWVLLSLHWQYFPAPDFQRVPTFLVLGPLLVS
ncbi:unnamed protein product [[Candida] boidinii]|uniref:Unnamed protein product n=1 Tax=Candida boidinii TaxID=5477 RepID=A0A9W6SYN6_CANBO|nr:unnamed protein product [[Candida] boidinii]GMG05120.1 unnamed protein product [[Candida] boidinii]